MSKRRLEAACPDCGSDMVLRDSKYGLFYGCVRWPACDATHGAHADGTPLGVPANKETRRARMAAHDSFDQLWKEASKKGRKSARKNAYAWLREQLGLTKEECHIGKFDVAMCAKVVELCEKRRKMAYYVSNEGEVLTFRMGSPKTILLSNGVEIPDPPTDGQLFATEVSANKMAELIRDHGLEEAKKRHKEWVRHGGHLD